MKYFNLGILCFIVFVVAIPHVDAQAANGVDCLGAVDCTSGYCDQTDPNSSTYGTCQPNPFTPENMGVSAPATSNSGGSDFTALAPIPGLTDPGSTAVVSSTGLASFFNNLYKYMIGLAATLAVIMIIWGGLEISTKDSVSKQTDGKERIYNAIFGLVLVLSPVLVFSIINPAILNLSLNLPALKTAPGAPVSNNFGTGNAPAAIAADCSVALGNGTVGCPTQEAALAFKASCSNGNGSIFTTNDPKLPYSASCNSLQPFQGHRDYTDVTQIPKGYWCFKVKIITNATVSYTYVCQVDNNSCSSVALNNPVSGQIVGSGGCDQY